MQLATRVRPQIVSLDRICLFEKRVWGSEAANRQSAHFPFTHPTCKCEVPQAPYLLSDSSGSRPVFFKGSPERWWFQGQPQVSPVVGPVSVGVK